LAKFAAMRRASSLGEALSEGHSARLFSADLFSTGEELERRANGHDLNGTDADLTKDVRQPVVM